MEDAIKALPEEVCVTDNSWEDFSWLWLMIFNILSRKRFYRPSLNSNLFLEQ